MRRTILFWLQGVVLLAFFGTLAMAEEPASLQTQTGSSEATSPDRVNIRDAVEILREQHLIQELRLSAPRAQVIIEKMRSMRNLKKEYQLQQYRLENELAGLLSMAEHDEAKITTILQELKNAKSQFYQKLLRSDEEFQQLLTSEEQAKYVLFQRTFNQKLKDVIVSIRKQHAQESSRPSQILRNQDSESVIRQPR